MFMEVEQSNDVIIILIFQSQQWGEGWRGVHVRHDDLLLPLSVRRNFYLQIVHCGVGGGTFWLKPETVWRFGSRLRLRWKRKKILNAITFVRFNIDLEQIKKRILKPIIIFVRRVLLKIL